MVERLTRAKDLVLDDRDLVQNPLFAILSVYLIASLHIAEFNGMFLLLSHSTNGFRDTLNDSEKSSFDTVSKEAILVYRVAVFDSFLNNITKYLLAKFPHKATENIQMPVAQLLGRKRMEIINGHITKKAKAIALNSFPERIRWIEASLKKPLGISKTNMDLLKNITNTRNSVIHEGHAFQFALDEELGMHIAFDRKTVNDLRDYDFDVLGKIAATIYAAVVADVQGRDLHNNEVRSLEAIDPERKRPIPTRDEEQAR